VAPRTVGGGGVADLVVTLGRRWVCAGENDVRTSSTPVLRNCWE